ncbi:hypothetical protein HRR95_005583, partial [Exophiala dermatitidis]
AILRSAVAVGGVKSSVAPAAVRHHHCLITNPPPYYYTTWSTNCVIDPFPLSPSCLPHLIIPRQPSIILLKCENAVSPRSRSLSGIFASIQAPTVITPPLPPDSSLQHASVQCTALLTSPPCLSAQLSFTGHSERERLARGTKQGEGEGQG